MERPKLDYDNLLNDWADELFKQAEEFEEKRDKADVGSYKHGYYRGKHDATIAAITKLSILEGRKNKKYRID